MTEQQQARRLHLIHCAGCSDCKHWRPAVTLNDIYAAMRLVREHRCSAYCSHAPVYSKEEVDRWQREGLR